MEQWASEHPFLLMAISNILAWIGSHGVSMLPSPEQLKELCPDIGPVKMFIYSKFYASINVAAGNAARVFPRLRAGGNGRNGNV